MFVHSTNKKLGWTRTEKVGYNLLSILYPALLPAYIRKVQNNNCLRLVETISTTLDESRIWKNDQEWMRGLISLKVQFSKSLDLAHLDFIDSRKTALAYEGPKLPLTIIMGGQGNFSHPFILDYDSDPIVRSICMKIRDDKVWKKFTQNLNSKLQSLQLVEFNWFISRKLFEILSFVEMANKEIFLSNGFTMNMFMIEVKKKPKQVERGMRSGAFNRTEAYIENHYKLDLNYLHKKKKNLNNFISFIKRQTLFCADTHFKLAIVLNKINNNRHSSIFLSRPIISQDNNVTHDSHSSHKKK
jgi:hypothetical protein